MGLFINTVGHVGQDLKAVWVQICTLCLDLRAMWVNNIRHAALLSMCLKMNQHAAPLCIFLSSQHFGFWSDRVEHNGVQFR